MMNRNLWLGTALLSLMIGAGATPAMAQQYFTRFKETDKPAIEVDMSILGEQPEPPKMRLADSMYVRSPEFEDHSAPPQPANKAEPAEDVTDAIVAQPMAAKPVLIAPPPSAPEKKKSKSVQKKPKNQPSLVISSEPAPEAAAKAAPRASGPIISQPPAPEPAAVAPQHRDIRQLATPIISNPPDAPQRPIIQGVVVAPAPAPVFSPAPVAAMETPPNMMSAPASPVISAPAAPVVSAPVPAIISAPVPAVVAAPEMPPQAEQRPSLAPLPDIKVVHEADYPEMSDPAPVAQPEPVIAGAPLEQPPPLPKARKVGHTTAAEIMPLQHPLAESAMPVPPSVEAMPEKAVDVAIPAPAPVAEAPSMPVVPTIADLTLPFSGNSSDLTGEARKKLDAVIGQMKEMTAGRLQVRGFAAGEDGSKSSARRIALSRALSVRSYLMDKGVKPTRVDVRAMGSETERSPLDRVDLVFVR